MGNEIKEIQLTGVRQNNLKNIDVQIPLNKLTVVCGPSGSGKSSLAFETLFAEGQRRFIESMNTYARQFLNKAPKPDVESVVNIPPAVAIEQKNSVKSSRSTVGTVTEVTDYLRLLFEKLSEAHCPTHQIKTIKLDPTSATDRLISVMNGKRCYLFAEVKRAPQAAWKQQLGQLISQGFTRICLKKPLMSAKGTPDVLDLTDGKDLKKALCKDDFYLLIDRLSISEENRMRIFDSVKDAYEANETHGSAGNLRAAYVVSTEGETLHLREAESCPACDYSPPEKQSSLFSFNSPLGACGKCKGFGNILTLDPQKVIPNPRLSLRKGALNPFTMPSAASEKKDLFVFCKKNNIDLDTPWSELPEEQQQLLWTGGKGFIGVEGLFEYLEQIKYKMHVRVFISRYRSPFTCPDCKGARLRKEALHFLFRKHSMHDLSTMRIAEIRDFFAKVKSTSHETAVAAEIFRQLNSRLSFLDQVGVSYLALDRETKTLSGGEFQRLMLANQLGMGLSQTLYVLDEPTIGLHPRDNDRLIKILHGLKDLGNTLVIVEHDLDVIASSEHVLEMGPGSGSHGGEVVFAGESADFFKSDQSLTANYLRPNFPRSSGRIPRPVTPDHKYKLELRGCSGHNLKEINVDIPLNRLVAVTGVSGSGKSTLISRTLYPILAAELGIEHGPSLPIESLDGVQFLKSVILMDQSPIGKTARSNPVTYLKAFDAIRTLMSQVPESKAQGYTAGTFSLNVDGGRCPVCKGTGFEEIDMMFMDNVILPCDACDGKKYRQEILDILYKGKNVHEILSMTVAEAMQFFINVPQVRKPLSILKEVGLDYLTLGQPASTLSGGESQRLKIAKELNEVQQRSTLYILDEPTTGLHFREIELLMKVLHRLVDAGASVLVIEHNLDVIREADWVIDLGPDAGPKGGTLVAEGPPLELAQQKTSLTGQYLREYIFGPTKRSKS